MKATLLFLLLVLCLEAEAEDRWLVGDLARLISYENEVWIDTALEDTVLHYEGSMFLLVDTVHGWPLEIVLSAELVTVEETYLYSYYLPLEAVERTFKHLSTGDSTAPVLMFTMWRPEEGKYKFSLATEEGSLMHWNFKVAP